MDSSMTMLEKMWRLSNPAAAQERMESLTHEGLRGDIPTYLEICKMSHSEYVGVFHSCTCVVTLSCPTLCDPVDHSPPSSCVHGDSPGKNTGMGCHAFLQVIFPTQELNQGLLHCRQIFYQLTYQENPCSIPESGRYPEEGIGYPLQYSWASLVAQLVKNLPAMQETWVWSLG